jgi:hypothetical protein
MFVFRPILNTSAEYANFYFPAQHETTLPYMMGMIFYIFTGAIVANLFVIYLSFFSPLVTGNFKYFMANVALCDLCGILSVCFETCAQMYHDFMNVPYTATSCYARIIFPLAFAACMCFALPLVAVNRYVVIVMQRNDWFTKRRVFLLCVCSYLPLIGPLIDLLFAPYVTDYIDCDFILYTPYIYEVSDILYHKTRVHHALHLISYLAPNFCFQNVFFRHVSSEHNNYKIIAVFPFRGHSGYRTIAELLFSARLPSALRTYQHCISNIEQDTRTNLRGEIRSESYRHTIIVTCDLRRAGYLHSSHGIIARLGFDRTTPDYLSLR